MASKVAQLLERQKQLDAKIESVVKDRNPDAPARSRTPAKEQVFGAPHARKGEDPLSSRGYQFQRVIGLMTKAIQPEFAKIELDVHDRMREALVVGGGFETAQGSEFLAPLGTDFLDDKTIDQSFRREIKGLILQGTEGADYDEMRHIHAQVYRAQGQKSSVANPQSYLDQTLGGSLVGPPEQGELIQLLRNKEALINAGARVVPLPPSGRLKYPRQTGATTGGWLGENTTGSVSQFKTGSILLTGKKAFAMVVMPSELIRFGSPASEAIVRADMTKTLALTLDKGLLDGPGGDNVPLGLATMGTAAGNPYGMAIVTPTAANTLSPQDTYKFISGVEVNNAEFEGYIMRPEIFWAMVEARAAVYNGTTTVPQGQFVFNQFRALEDGFQKRLNGYKVTTTPQVSNTRGNGSQTFILGGMWSKFVIAMFGAIEFMQSDQGLTLMQNDQVAIRAILTADGAAQMPGAFAFCDALNFTLGN